MVKPIIVLNVSHAIKIIKKFIGIKFPIISMRLNRTARVPSVVTRKKPIKTLAIEHWNSITHKTTRSLLLETQYQREWDWIELKKKLTSA